MRGHVSDMATETCRNCGDPAIESRDVLVRNDATAAVTLCRACHDAMGEEFIWNEA